MNPATAAPACPGSAAVAHFRLEAVLNAPARAVSVERVNRLRAGDRIRYVPSDPAKGQDLEKGRVALIVVGAEGQRMYLLPAVAATGQHEWTLPADASTVAVAYGPNGLDEEKVRSLITGDRELLEQLAAYSEKSAQTETILNALSGLRPRDDRSMEAALSGLAATTPGARLDRNAPLEQQTLALLKGINPALRGYDPLAAEPQQRMQQSATLAASVAGMFFGSTVGLAGGGAALFLNMRSVMFPKTELRSALMRSEGTPSLCAPAGNPARTRLAYLWARRLSGGAAPVLALEAGTHVAIGQPARVPVQGTEEALMAASRAQRWKLVDAAGLPVEVKVSAPAGEKALRIAEVPGSLAPGPYALFAEWDWEEARVGGELLVDRIPDLSRVRMPAEWADRLVTQTGKARVHLTGAEFRFVRALHLLKTGDALARPAALTFAVDPAGRDVEMELDTSTLDAGEYLLQVEQIDGSKTEIPVAVQQPLPRLRGLPLRVSSGEELRVRLEGEGLERIESISAPALGKDALVQWEQGAGMLSIRVPQQQRFGVKLPLLLAIAGRQQPYEVEGALEVLRPRPRIAAVQPAVQEAGGVALRAGEIDGTRAASFSLRVENGWEGARAEVRCRGQQDPVAVEISSLSADVAYMTVPAARRHGCVLEASLEGGEPATLGRVVLLPQIREFRLSWERAGENRFAGTLAGTGLEMIEKVGWTAGHAEVVTEIPAPNGQGQKLGIAMPWPAPEPHAALMVWLRGETEPRPTTVRY